MTTCNHCDGRGFRVLESGEAVTCECTVIHQMLGVVRRIPGLAEFQALGKGCVDFTGEQPEPLCGSAIIRCAWQPMIDHVAGWAFAHARRGSIPKVHLTTCAEVRAMYFGEDREGGHHQASQLWLLGSYDLVVVRVLPLKRNKATADALIEAASVAKSLWLVHGPGDTFAEGHPAWSPDIAEVMGSVSRLDLGSTNEPGGVMRKLGLVGKEDANG